MTCLIYLPPLAWATLGEPTRRREHYFPNYLEGTTLPNLVALLRQLPAVAVALDQAWFWFLGERRFLFAGVEVYGQFRTFAKTWSILIIIWLAGVLAFRLLDCHTSHSPIAALTSHLPFSFSRRQESSSLAGRCSLFARSPACYEDGQYSSASVPN